jgi:hypothetical protein
LLIDSNGTKVVAAKFSGKVPQNYLFLYSRTIKSLPEMKTSYLSNHKRLLVPLMGALALMTVSCGSYQSTAYQDSDGVYGDSRQERGTTSAASNSESNHYKEYFASLKDQNPELFTNPDDYNSAADSTALDNRSVASNGGWGSDNSNVTVNVYGNNWAYPYWYNYWATPYWGFGWDSWYGANWSIGWGWGGYYPYSYWGYGYPYAYYPHYYGGYYANHWHNNHYSSHSYVYNSGRRGQYQYNGTRNGMRNYTNGGRSYTTNSVRTPVFSNGTRSQNGTRSYNHQSQNNNYSTPRSSSPTRSYSPSYSSGSRSSGSSGGGGYSGGGGRGGGGRR